MKKLFVILGCLVMIYILSYSPNKPYEIKAAEDYTFWDVQDMIVDYLDDSGRDIELGTDEVYGFFVDQLYNNVDENMTKHKHYDLMKIYMGQYIGRYETYLEDPSIFGFNLNQLKNISIYSDISELELLNY